MKERKATATLTNVTDGGFVEKDITTVTLTGQNEEMRMAVSLRFTTGAESADILNAARGLVRAFERGDQMDMFDAVNDTKKGGKK